MVSSGWLWTLLVLFVVSGCADGPSRRALAEDPGDWEDFPEGEAALEDDTLPPDDDVEPLLDTPDASMDPDTGLPTDEDTNDMDKEPSSTESDGLSDGELDLPAACPSMVLPSSPRVDIGAVSVGEANRVGIRWQLADPIWQIRLMSARVLAPPNATDGDAGEFTVTLFREDRFGEWREVAAPFTPIPAGGFLSEVEYAPRDLMPDDGYVLALELDAGAGVCSVVLPIVVSYKGTPRLVAIPPEIDFGSVFVGADAVLPLALENATDESATIAVRLDGLTFGTDDARPTPLRHGAFEVGGLESPPAILPPRASWGLTVRCRPEAVGMAEAILQVAHTHWRTRSDGMDTPVPPLTVRLRCRGDDRCQGPPECCVDGRPVNAGSPCDTGSICQLDGRCDAGGRCVGQARDCSGVVLDAGCQVAECDETLGCRAKARPDDTPCDDGLFCMVNDRCQGGVCVGVSRATVPHLACARGHALCSLGVCDERARRCTIRGNPAALGQACDDGDPCSSDTVCLPDGQCGDGVDTRCPAPAEPQCARALCDPVRGCVTAPIREGEPCDDGRYCTVEDRCRSGRCLGGPRTCVGGGGSGGGGCNEFQCDDTAQACVPIPRAAGLPCDDGFFCTVGEQCDGAGRCAGGQPRDCADPTMHPSCQKSHCDEVAGICVQRPFGNGSPCDDGQFCTIEDRCDETGHCLGSPRDCADPEKSADCQLPRCDEAVGRCEAPSAVVDTPCDDGLFCTVDDRCDDHGRCMGRPRNCADPALSPDCQAPACLEDLDRCEAPPLTPDTPCDDGAFCTVNDRCSPDGRCDGDVRDCAAVVTVPDCGMGVCDEQADTCREVPDSSRRGSPCDDGEFCTVDERCLPDGSCNNGGQRDCTSAVVEPQCQAPRCDAHVGVCTADSVREGEVCDDGRPETGDDRCRGGRCGGNPCTCRTVDECCDGCFARRTGQPCDDGLFCTVGGICADPGVCRGQPRDCDSERSDPQCQSAACDEGTDRCVVLPAHETRACDDGRFCTRGDACLGGRCVGQTRLCDDGNPCTDDACDESAAQCRNVAISRSCDDGRVCTQGDTCQGGACVGTARVCPSADNECRLAGCAENRGGCFMDAQPDGTPCSRGICRGGQCENCPCSLGEKRCVSSSRAAHCDAQVAPGCYTWREYDCPTGSVCSNGTCVAQGDVRITVTWDRNLDVDLQVWDPCGNLINYRQVTATCQGFQGRLSVDNICGTTTDFWGQIIGPGGPENVRWQGGYPRGEYRVGLDFFSDNCTAGASPNYRVEIATPNGQIQVFTGTLRYPANKCSSNYNSCLIVHRFTVP